MWLAVKSVLLVVSSAAPNLGPKAPGALLDGCQASIPSLGDVNYSLTGQQRNSVRNTTTTNDFKLSGAVKFYDQSGLLSSLALTTFGQKSNDTYNFVCTFSDDEPHVATCTLTFEQPSRAQGPAWVTARFHSVSPVSINNAPQRCVARAITIIGSYPFSYVTDDAGIYAMTAALEDGTRVLTPPAHSSMNSANSPNVLILYAPDATGQIQQLANAIATGASSASANVKILTVQYANYQRDVFKWADAVIMGSPVYNGNAAPSVLDFINSFDFEDKLTVKVASVFATGGCATAGLQETLDDMSRGMGMFGMITIGGNSWENARGTGIVTNGSEMIMGHALSLATDQGTRVAEFAKIVKSSAPSPSPTPSISDPPSWGQTWRATVSANLTQVGYDAGLVIVNFTGDCPTPRTQRMLTIYGDFDTVLTRCDLGYEFIIDPPSRGGGCHPRLIGHDVDHRICEACSCPFCVRDTNGSFTHGEQYPSKTQWETKDEMSIMGIKVNVWKGKAISALDHYALHTSIAYSAEDPVVPVFVNVSHPLWMQSAARIDHFSREIDDSVFDIPPSCLRIDTPGDGLHLI